MSWVRTLPWQQEFLCKTVQSQHKTHTEVERPAQSAFTYQLRVDQVKELLTVGGHRLSGLEAAHKDRWRQAEEKPWEEGGTSR